MQFTGMFLLSYPTLSRDIVQSLGFVLQKHYKFTSVVEVTMSSISSLAQEKKCG